MWLPGRQGCGRGNVTLQYFVRPGDVREARTQTAMALHGIHVTQREGVLSMFHHVTTSHQ